MPHSLKAPGFNPWSLSKVKTLVSSPFAFSKFQLAPLQLGQYASFLVRRLPPSYPATDRRAVWANALAAAAAAAATMETSGQVVQAVKAAMRAARRKDPTGERTWWVCILVESSSALMTQ
jgi:hypothetical protein